MNGFMIKDLSGRLCSAPGCGRPAEAESKRLREKLVQQQSTGGPVTVAMTLTAEGALHVPAESLNAMREWSDVHGVDVWVKLQQRNPPEPEWRKLLRSMPKLRYSDIAADHAKHLARKPSEALALYFREMAEAAGVRLERFETQENIDCMAFYFTVEGFTFCVAMTRREIESAGCMMIAAKRWFFAIRDAWRHAMAEIERLSQPATKLPTGARPANCPDCGAAAVGEWHRSDCKLARPEMRLPADTFIVEG